MLAMASADYRTITDFLFETARRSPDRLAVVDDTSSLSYGELAAQAAALGRTLKRQGLTAGTRVIVHLPNTVDFLRAHFGVLWAGGVSVPVESAASVHTVAAAARNSAARWVIALPQVAEQFEEVIPSTAGTEIVVLTPDAYADQAAQEERPDVRPDQLACLLFTTGSTASPKGVPLRHENVCAAVENLVQVIGYTEADREVIILPLAHSFGLGHVYCNFRVGGAVRLFEGLSKVGRILKAIREFKATGFPGTPLGFGLLLDRFREPFVESARGLRFIVVNSAPLPPHRAKQLMADLPDTSLFVYYGLTEASRSTLHLLNGTPEHRLLSVGRAMPQIDIRIDGENGNPLPAGAIGQVTITGPTVPGLYWAADDATADGYRFGRLQSGDLGYLDADGYLFITGRIKDQINIGGTKVAAPEVEAALLEHHEIIDCTVLGMPSRVGMESEVVVACVVLREDAVLDSPGLQSFLRTRLEQYKIPSEIYRVERVPRATTGKVLRPEVQALVSFARGDL
jgi:long-chain acyl-CoA synthetase